VTVGFPLDQREHVELADSDRARSFLAPNTAAWLPSVRMILVELHNDFEPECTKAIETATRGLFDRLRVIDEYAFYVAAEEFSEEILTSGRMHSSFRTRRVG
jgi:hypothetical protein